MVNVTTGLSKEADFKSGISHVTWATLLPSDFLSYSPVADQIEPSSIFHSSYPPKLPFCWTENFYLKENSKALVGRTVFAPSAPTLIWNSDQPTFFL